MTRKACCSAVNWSVLAQRRQSLCFQDLLVLRADYVARQQLLVPLVMDTYDFSPSCTRAPFTSRDYHPCTIWACL